MNERPEPPGTGDWREMHEWHEWPELSGIRDGIPPPPGPEIVRAALMRSALDGLEVPATPEPSQASRASRPSPASQPSRLSRRTSSPHLAAALRGLRRARALLAVEVRFLNPAVWLASFLTMAVSVCFTLAQGVSQASHAELMLALAAPLVAIMSVAGSYGPQHDDAFELVAATPTSPRVILLARMTLVFGYDLALALVASAALSSLGAVPAGLTSLITAWLGPMTMLAAFTLLLSVWWTPAAAMGGGLALWTLYALATRDIPALDGFQGFWTTSPATISISLALALVAVIAVGRGEPIRRTRATHRS